MLILNENRHKTLVFVLWPYSLLCYFHEKMKNWLTKKVVNFINLDLSRKIKTHYSDIIRFINVKNCKFVILIIYGMFSHFIIIFTWFFSRYNTAITT